MSHSCHLRAFLIYKALLFRVGDGLQALKHDLTKQVHFGSNISFLGQLSLFDLELELVKLIFDCSFTSASGLDNAAFLRRLELFSDLLIDLLANQLNTITNRFLIKQTNGLIQDLPMQLLESQIIWHLVSDMLS